MWRFGANRLLLLLLLLLLGSRPVTVLVCIPSAACAVEAETCMAGHNLTRAWW